MQEHQESPGRLGRAVRWPVQCCNLMTIRRHIELLPLVGHGPDRLTRNIVGLGVLVSLGIRWSSQDEYGQGNSFLN